MKDTIFSEDPSVYNSLLEAIEYQEFPTESSYACNDTVVHAKILQKHLLKNAKKHVRLYTSLFCKDFYCDADVYSAFESIKNKNVQINVIVTFNDTDEQVGQKEAIDKYKKTFGANITFKFLNNIDQASSNKLLKSNNFLTIDDNSVRYELSAPDIESCKGDKIKDTEATACFNDTEGQVLKLNNAFDDTFSKIQ